MVMGFIVSLVAVFSYFFAYLNYADPFYEIMDDEPRYFAIFVFRSNVIVIIAVGREANRVCRGFYFWYNDSETNSATVFDRYRFCLVQRVGSQIFFFIGVTSSAFIG